MIKAVLIDIDDTIFDFEKCSKNSFLKTLEKFNIKFKEEDFSYFNRVNDILWTKQKLGEINIKEVFIKRDYLMGKYFNIDIEKGLFNDLFVKFLYDEIEMVDGIEDLLLYLSDKYKIFTASNGIFKMQENRLKKSNLDKYFDKIFVSDKIGYEKPDKKFFQKIMDLTKFSNDDLIMIGDSIKSDIIGAKNSKIKSIYFNKENKKISDKNFTYQVKNLSEIKKIL
ncbi:YjjG family noncanonical pyrimidine nucleotidase [Anaerococcus vaginalis]|uniref:YjjG family noncanonical pyrimidine nucleotidase n=2 Tax=Anaerococcus vaginalis TaxID=33037 RepID=A0A7T4K4M0_9FIRM|nr:YjjG family noncanonical pyrimidine nucleotidase [Anaerococcus vaginalis]EEU12630.1 putative HAD hydrolase, TIGR02254 family [Anaerococcus vaginalis ATCC 51170]QQB61329.1 YjjG family noncanonical pyrimidine nucleotidase [Anaerococcus vaginalis]